MNKSLASSEQVMSKARKSHEESDWYSRAFPVLKSNGEDVRVDTDFKI